MIDYSHRQRSVSYELLSARYSICASPTRADLMADVTLLSSRMNRGTIKDIRDANAAIARAQRNPFRGLIYRKLTPPLVLYSISDSSFATSSTSYAVEGHAVVLAEKRHVYSDAMGHFPARTLDSRVHLLVASSKKAKRISHSTSHAEALAMYNTSIHCEQVAARLTEVKCPWPPTLAQCIAVEENGLFDMQLLQMTDCMDLLELITGKKGVPQDRSFRLIILALREKRLTGRFSSSFHVDTHDMLANALTKRVTDDRMFAEVLSAGRMSLQHRAVVRAAEPVGDFDEDWLISTTRC